MKVVYCHNRKYPRTEFNEKHDGFSLKGYTLGLSPLSRGGSTVAMEVIQSWLLDQLEMGNTIERKVGIARCSEDDNYCKKTGRELAKSRMKVKTLTVINIIKRENTPTVVFFEDEDQNLFELKVSKDPYCAILVRMLDD